MTRRGRRAAERAAARKRMRTYRQRLQRGSGVIRVEFPTDETAIGLRALGRLSPDRVHDKSSVDEALQKFLADVIQGLAERGNGEA